jgi:hypothetical protein
MHAIRSPGNGLQGLSDRCRSRAAVKNEEFQRDNGAGDNSRNENTENNERDPFLPTFAFKSEHNQLESQSHYTYLLASDDPTARALLLSRSRQGDFYRAPALSNSIRQFERAGMGLCDLAR